MAAGTDAAAQGGGPGLFLGSTVQLLIAGEAFEADYAETLIERPDGTPTRVAWGRVAVSRRGRVRSEDHSTGLVHVMDTVRGDLAMVELRSGRVRLRSRFPLEPPAGSRVGHVTPQPRSALDGPDTEPLGEREIEGLLCDGLRIRARGADGDYEQEHWTSRHLGVLVRWRHTTATTERVLQLTNVQRREPDARLFAALD